MPTTLKLDDHPGATAMEPGGIEEKPPMPGEALKGLIARERARGLVPDEGSLALSAARWLCLRAIALVYSNLAASARLPPGVGAGTGGVAVLQ